MLANKNGARTDVLAFATAKIGKQPHESSFLTQDLKKRWIVCRWDTKTPSEVEKFPFRGRTFQIGQIISIFGYKTAGGVQHSRRATANLQIGQ
jgi:hypothetical protein